MLDLLRLLASWGIVFYHSNYPVMTNVVISWLPFVRDRLFGWALPFFYTTSAYSILAYLQSGKPRWRLWSTYAKHLCILITLYQLVRIVGMHQSFIPCTTSLSCWFEVVRSGNHSIGYYLFDWLLFFVVAIFFVKIHAFYGPIVLCVFGIGCLILGYNPLFERPAATWGFTFGIGLFLFLTKFPQSWLIYNRPFLRHISYYIYLSHPFVYMATDRFVPTLLPNMTPNVILGVIIFTTIVISTGLAIGWEWWRVNHSSNFVPKF